MDLDQIPQTHKHTASLQGVYIAYPLCSSSVVVVYKFYGEEYAVTVTIQQELSLMTLYHQEN